MADYLKKYSTLLKVISESLSIGKEELTHQLESKYPLAKKLVSGFAVNPKVDNISSISSSFDKYITLMGVREFPMQELVTDPYKLFYASEDIKRSEDLAKKINFSNEISVLIVAIDKEGPYVLEGVHRLGALHLLGARSFPALVVVDLDSFDL